MSYNVRNIEVEQSLREEIRWLETRFPGKGIGLFVFTDDAGGSVFYISNCDRSEVVDAVEKWIKRQRQ